MRTLAPLTACALALAGLALVPAADAPPAPVVLATPGQALRVAAAHAGQVAGAHHGHCRNLRFVSLHAFDAAERPLMAQVLAFAVHSLSARQPLFQAMPLLGGLVVCVDLDYLGIDPRAWDRLGELGSGVAPFPEPLFHRTRHRREPVTRKRPVTYQVRVPVGWDFYGQPTAYRIETRHDVQPVTRWEQRTVVSPGDFLPADAAIALRELTGTDFPIFEARWFVANALVEPRYHELLGTGESLDSVKRLAGLNERTVGRVRAAQLLGVVLFSEVAERNRRIERSPTPARQGRGSFWISYDFKTSIKRQDALADLLGEDADANESIFSLFNGLHGYFVNDGKGNRLDGADPNVALDSRTRLKRKVVDTGRQCMGCHSAESGLISVDDEVRRTSLPEVTLAVDRLRKAHDYTRAEQIQDRYLTTDINELVQADQLVYARAVQSCTGGLAPAKVNQVLQREIWKYIDGKVTLESISPEVGYPPAVIGAAIRAASGAAQLHDEPFDSHLAGLALGRPQRRDQIEPALADLQDALYTYTGGRP